MENLRKLINWSELSRHITKGDRNCIRFKKIPEIHLEKVNDLLKKVQEWEKKWS